MLLDVLGADEEPDGDRRRIDHGTQAKIGPIKNINRLLTCWGAADAKMTTPN